MIMMISLWTSFCANHTEATSVRNPFDVLKSYEISLNILAENQQ